MMKDNFIIVDKIHQKDINNYKYNIDQRTLKQKTDSNLGTNKSTKTRQRYQCDTFKNRENKQVQN